MNIVLSISKKIGLLFIFLLFIQIGFTQKNTTMTYLDHIAQYVNNLAISTAFYTNILGLDSIPEPFHDGKHTWLQIGVHSQLHLISGADSGMVHNKNNHLCFTLADFDAFIEKLSKNNIEFENWAGEKQAITTRPDGIHQIWFRDPDGYWIEVNDGYKL